MKHCKIYLSVLFLLLACGLISSCKRDLGNYAYRSINELTFPGIDTANGYTADLGTTLVVTPGISATIDKNLTGDYSYEWKISKIGFDEQVISEEKDLNLLVNVLPGSYIITYGVTDKETGVKFLTKFPFTATTPYFEGWLVLNNVGGSTRLDFLSYRNNSFEHTADLLDKLSVDLPALDEPRQVLFTNYRLSTFWKGVQLVTSTGTYRLDQENFGYTPDGYITKTMIGNPPADFRPDNILYCNTNNATADNFFIYADGNWFQQGYGAFSPSPINFSAVTGQSFRASPYGCYSNTLGANLVLFDEDNRRFVKKMRLSVTEYETGMSVVAPELNFPSGKDLLYMTDNDVLSGTNNAYAVLKDPGIDKFYLLRFSFGGPSNSNLQAVNYFEEITATDFAQADKFAISPNLGYLFYSTAGKLYEYDMFLKTSKLMLDRGNEQISLLVFDPNRKPAEWKNSLMVGSYDPAGEEGENGTLTQYEVPPVNGDLIEQNKWTGLGRVVSVSYRFR